MSESIVPPDLIKAIETYVKSEMLTNDSSHDFFHIERVRNLSLYLSQKEGLSPEQTRVAEISSLFHDLGDWKYVVKPQIMGRWDAPIEIETFLKQHRVDDSIIDQVTYTVSHVGFSKELEGSVDSVSPELTQILAVVQDADRLDALGAIGIARCLTFGGAKNRILYDPAIPPRLDLSASEYKTGKSTTMNHFPEKLFKLADLMKTKTGQGIAKQRTQVMKDFTARFEEEFYFREGIRGVVS